MKPRTDLLPARALLGAARVLGFGAGKHGAHGYRTLPDAWDVYYGKVTRHLLERRAGVLRDPETGVSPLVNALADLMLLVELELAEETWR